MSCVVCMSILYIVWFRHGMYDSMQRIYYGMYDSMQRIYYGMCASMNATVPTVAVSGEEYFVTL